MPEGATTRSSVAHGKACAAPRCACALAVVLGACTTGVAPARTALVLEQAEPPPLEADAGGTPPISSEAYRALVEAELALGRGDSPGAISLLREAVAHDPTSPYLHLRLADGLLEAGAPDDALRAAEDALALAPDSVVALRLRGQSLLAAGDAAAARQTLEAVLARAPGDRAASTMLAELHAEAGDLDSAERVIDELMSREPGALDGYLALARVFAARGLPERALVHVERALARDADEPEALTLKLTLLWALGRFEAALPAAQAMARAAGDSASVRRDLLSAHALADHMDAARALAAAWLADDASEAMKLLVSEAWERTGAIHEAIDVLASPTPGGGSVRLRGERARLLLLTGDAPGATLAACRGAPAADETAEARASLAVLCGEALLAQKRIREAGALVEQHHAAFGSSAQLLELLADVLAQGALPSGRARAILEAALGATAPESLDAAGLDAAARALESIPDSGAARMFLEDTLRRRPTEPGVLFAFARHLERTGEIRAAAELVERMMDRGQRGIQELNFAAFTLAEAGARLDDASRYAWRALVMDPLNGYVVDTLGWCLLSAGDIDSGVALLRRADLLAPGDGEVLFHLATAEARAGNAGAARAAAQRALERVPPHARLRPRVEALWRSLEPAHRPGAPKPGDGATGGGSTAQAGAP